MDVNKVIENIFEPGAKVLHSLHGGMMNESFVVLSKGKKYVLYLPTKQANEMVDRSLEEYNHKLIYKLGITSENMYFSTLISRSAKIEPNATPIKLYIHVFVLNAYV